MKLRLSVPAARFYITSFFAMELFTLFRSADGTRAQSKSSILSRFAGAVRELNNTPQGLGLWHSALNRHDLFLKSACRAKASDRMEPARIARVCSTCQNCVTGVESFGGLHSLIDR